MLHHLSTRCSFRAGHMLLSHFEPVLKFKVARPLSPEEKNHCEVMVITYRLGVGRRKSENRFGCFITIFLDSLPRIWIGRQQSPLYVLPPFISPKTVWSPPQNPPTKCPFPPPPCSRGRWIMSGGALQTYHNSLVNLLIPLNRTLNSKGQ